MEIDYYELLEITRTADKDSIKKAYRKLALKYHPDRNQGDKEAESKFKLINEAYEILSDDEKRSIYDRYGRDGLKSSMQGSGFNFADIDIEGIFSDFFGFSGSRKRNKRQSSEKYSENLSIPLVISFKEAVFGTKKNVEFMYKSFCKDCKGTGSKDGEVKICPKCEGRGQVGLSRGFMTFVQTCDECRGEGSIVKDKCKTCSGLGYENKRDSIELDIPEGIDDAMSLRVAQRGNLTQSGSRGALLVKISVQDDETFIRDGSDIYLKFPVFFTQAALGAKVKIPTIRGHAFLELPVGAKDGDHFVLEKEGVKDIHSEEIGRQIVQISISFPKHINDEQKELLAKLNESFGVNEEGIHQEQQGFFDKIASWFK